MTHDSAVLEQEAEEIVKNIGIPPCPVILTKLVQETRREDPDFRKIGKWISSDASLAAAVLKIVNSPFYGLSTKATSVTQALSLIGLTTVTQLVTGLLLRQAFPVANHRIMEYFWNVSSNVALISAWLASRTAATDRDDAYTFGLFRECGIPVLLLKFSDYSRILTAARLDNTKRLIELEGDNYWIDHCQVGHYLAKSWSLPEHTCLAILRHHDYSLYHSEQTELDRASLKLVALGLVAEHLFARHCGEPDDVEWHLGGGSALTYLGISPADLDLLSDEINSLLGSE